MLDLGMDKDLIALQLDEMMFKFCSLDPPIYLWSECEQTVFACYGPQDIPIGPENRHPYLGPILSYMAYLTDGLTLKTSKWRYAMPIPVSVTEVELELLFQKSLEEFKTTLCAAKNAERTKV